MRKVDYPQAEPWNRTDELEDEMPNLTFYRQARIDGGIRTGIELDEDTVFEHFEEGGPEPDPTLLWYVELRCQGPGLPDDPREARTWLIDHEEVICDGFSRCASEFEAGRDIDAYPLLWSKFSRVPAGVEMTIACATNRRNWAISLPLLLKDIELHWRERLQQLQPAEWVA
jgi:hypothetical protein